ncbi:MAG TPA: NAD-dependent epimerase/dehydratase family protein [Propionibacteriaceae bacterium]|nr:NAD-dependent epimerase/dehydratase family protein [Propionibacteriaceae bacterium]
MKVLVTGASGMLGGQLALALAARGDEVTVMQRRPSGLDLAEVLADVADADSVASAVAGQDAVVHLAAKVNITGAWADYQRANVVGTANVVAGCRSGGVGRLVHVSSPSVAHAGSSLVGVGAGPADPKRARGPYARSKAAAEQVALGADSRSLSVVAVRPHMVWGPGDTQLVARIVARGQAGRLPVIGTGAPLVDTTYVTNAVEALIAALDRCEEASGQALVVSNGEPRPIGEVLGSFCAAAGVSWTPRRIPTRLALAAGGAVELAWSLRSRRNRAAAEADPPLNRFLVEQLSTAHWFDQRHTRELLQWQPRVSWDAGLQALAESYRSASVS